MYLISDQVPYTQHYNFCCFLQTKQHVRDFVYKRHEADFVRVLTILEIFLKKNVYIICLPVGSITNKIKVRKVWVVLLVTTLGSSPVCTMQCRYVVGKDWNVGKNRLPIDSGIPGPGAYANIYGWLLDQKIPEFDKMGTQSPITNIYFAVQVENG